MLRIISDITKKMSGKMGESRHIGVRIICDSHNISSPCRDIYEEKIDAKRLK